MVDIYRTIQLNRADLDAVNIGNNRRALWPYTLGGTIMQRSHGQAIVHGADYVYDTQVVGYLHSFLAASGWEWIPLNDGDDGGEVLDFERNFGECRYVSAALELLFYAPAPYGFEIPEDEVETVQYAGAHGAGFLAAHDPATAFGLGYNIIRPDTGRLQEHCFLWPNHWVTEWDGDFYDANYNRRYGTLPEMALVQMAAKTERNLEDRGYQEIVTTVDLRGTNRAALDGVYVRTSGNDYGNALVQRAVQLNEALGFEARSRPFVGPFPRPYDLELPYTIELD